MKTSLVTCNHISQGLRHPASEECRQVLTGKWKRDPESLQTVTTDPKARCNVHRVFNTFGGYAEPKRMRKRDHWLDNVSFALIAAQHFREAGVTAIAATVIFWL